MLLKMRPFGKAELGAVTFCASCQPRDECGANGLPLTPNSIRILGRFQKLTTIHHPNLTRYVHLMRSKHERLIIVSEYYNNNLSLASKTGKYENVAELTKLACGVLQGLGHLNQQGLVHRNLSPRNILLDTEDHVLLAKYGLYYMTHCGADVSFPIGTSKYMAPEVLAQGPVQLTEINPTSDEPRKITQPPSGPKVDIWSLGLILLEAYLGIDLWENLTIQQLFRKILDFATSPGMTPLEQIAKEYDAVEKLQELPTEVYNLLKSCITVTPSKRPLSSELLELPLFKSHLEMQRDPPNGFYTFSTKLRCLNLELPNFDEDNIELDEDHLSERSIDEMFYLWQRAGGDLEGVLKKAGLIRSQPPITKLAHFVVEDGEMFGERRDRSTLLDDTVVILPQSQLRQRLQNVGGAAYYPLLEEEYNSSISNSIPISPSTGDLTETSKLPLVIRERDVEYQFHRIILFERLLRAYPYKKAHILKEARVDIPPLCRGQIWATLLEVEGDVQGRYDAADKETPIPTDRQIEVDIPRCHQYNDALSSPEGHAKFKRVLKAWVVSHQDYVYWQGLDSLTAPFLYLNFNDEALAFACLSAFIPKYLHKFFLKDNSSVIQEYLAVFGHLISFHDPELATHLDGIGFIPDLYAIPWFLTMYAHVFPLHKIFHLWDTLLLGNSSFPLCIGVAILQQLRDQLLSFGFNECILLFSDMPQIDIEQCVQESIRIFCTTPKSATWRQHAQKPQKSKSERRLSLSYYSIDYNDMPKTEQSIDNISLQELKCEKCPRISAEDLIELSELMGPSPTRSPTKKNRSGKPKILIIDVRSHEEYMRGAVPNSVNIPFGNAFSPDGELLPSQGVQTLNGHKNQVKVIVGSRNKQATHFAESVVRLKYTKICVLHKGIESLKSSRLLVVPTPDL